MNDEDLLETLRLAQRLGFFGGAPIEQAIVHSEGYVAALGALPIGARLLDLGSGGGLPGLVLAARYPAIAITLVDRRTKRTDFLARAVTRLGFAHVDVRADDSDDLVRDIVRGALEPFDVVTARGFGPPEFTIRTAAALCAGSGTIVVSEPPSGDRWDPDLLAELGLSGQPHGHVRVFRRFT